MVFIEQRIEKFLEYLEAAIYENKYSIDEYKYINVDEKFKDEKNIDTSDWDVLTRDGLWGGNRELFYFETTITTPDDCDGKALVYELRTGRESFWDAINPQFLAYVNGEVRHGLDVNHREILLTKNAKKGEQFKILLSAYTGDNNFSLVLDSEYKVFLPEVEKYYYDLKVPFETAKLLECDSENYIEIMKCVNESINLLDFREAHSKAFYETLKIAQDYLTKEFYDKKCGHKLHKIACVGHTHIDVAWLWTLKTTEDKAVRSFSTVLELMNEYPEYKFMSSQPQLYDYVKTNAPEIYEQIKARVKEGRWETEGGMWVEADCNVTSGESLVRQFLHGTRFFEKEFGTKNEILWLPDVFGYSAALPQIMDKCGIKYFMTTKISWNEINKMPCDTFYWEGIDGTEILTHFSPSREYGKNALTEGHDAEYFTTYNAYINPSQAKGSWQRYSQKHLNDEVLMSYGFGDGGGGPTKDMLEQQRRLEKGIPGSPVTKQSHSLEFFKRLENDVKDNKYTPKWVGELYLEYHRGTYTSMARNKRYNRKSEFAYQNIEFYYSLAKELLNVKYPKEELNASWEVILRNQFHDILPGSSIKEVYDDSDVEYKDILSKAKELKTEVLDKVVSEINISEGSVVIFNPNSTVTSAVVNLPLDTNSKNILLSDGKNKYPVQMTEDGPIAAINSVKSKGYSTLTVEEIKETSDSSMKITTKEVDTQFFNVKIDDKGYFTSIFDKKANREIIPEGKKANVIVSYEDRPHNYDAWDINNYYTEKSWYVDDVRSMEVVENGPIRGCIKISRSYLSSSIDQYIYFYNDLYCIDIKNEVDWKESQILLKNYFPVDVNATEATFDIQYGNVKRPTHFNTSWDFAKFEVCAHKWVDLSEDDYGLSILNESKYGYSIHDGVIGLTMLKSGIYPNKDADKEFHSFSYSLCPHSGDFKDGETVQKAYTFNNPYEVVVKQNNGGKLPTEMSFVSTDSENIVIEVVKEQEDSNDTIVRLYEYCNRRGSVTLQFDKEIGFISEIDMLEKSEYDLIIDKLDDKKVSFEVKPFEIKTLLVRFK